MAEFLQFFFSGLTVGAIYALVALGFTLIYNASDVINFAQGEFVMLGAYSAWALQTFFHLSLLQSLIFIFLMNKFSYRTDFTAELEV